METVSNYSAPWTEQAMLALTHGLPRGNPYPSSLLSWIAFPSGTLSVVAKKNKMMLFPIFDPVSFGSLFVSSVDFL